MYTPDLKCSGHVYMSSPLGYSVGDSMVAVPFSNIYGSLFIIHLQKHLFNQTSKFITGTNQTILLNIQYVEHLKYFIGVNILGRQN